MSADFNVFWNAYPKRVAKKDAMKAWAQAKPTEDTLHKMLDALAWQVADWNATSAFVPHPGTYLRGQRWEDERPRVLRDVQAAWGQQQKARERERLMREHGLSRDAANRKVGW